MSDKDFDVVTDPAVPLSDKQVEQAFDHMASVLGVHPPTWTPEKEQVGALGAACAPTWIAPRAAWRQEKPHGSVSVPPPSLDEPNRHPVVEKHTISAPNNPKHAAGVRKPHLDLVPGVAFLHMAEVFEHGASKYGPFNWRETAVVRSIYLAAAMRHLLLMMDGEDIDEESGKPHSAHVQSCMAILQDAELCGTLIDDRPAKGKLPDLLRTMTKRGER